MKLPLLKIFLVDVLVNLYFLNELINTSSYFFVIFFTIDLLRFSIHWALSYYVRKLIIIKNIMAAAHFHDRSGHLQRNYYIYYSKIELNLGF